MSAQTIVFQVMGTMKTEQQVNLLPGYITLVILKGTIG